MPISPSSLRRQLREKNIQLLVVRNELAQRATEGTPLGTALDDAEGSLALVWGARRLRVAGQRNHAAG